MIVGVPRETYPGERRVALVPAVIPSLTKAGIQVVVEARAARRLDIPTPTIAPEARGPARAG